MSQPQDLAKKLEGLTLAEAFGKFVADDPELRTLAEKASELSDRPAYLPDLEARRYGLGCDVWPVTGPPYFDPESPVGMLSPQPDEAEAKYRRSLADRYEAFVIPLQSGDVVAMGHSSDGILVTINKGIWSNDDYHCDFVRSDVGRFLEREDVETIPRFAPVWTGVEIKAPNRSVAHGGTSKGGRPPKHPWDSAFSRLVVHLGRKGTPETGAELCDWMLDAFHDEGVDAPGKGAVKKWLREKQPRLWQEATKKK